MHKYKKTIVFDEQDEQGSVDLKAQQLFTDNAAFAITPSEDEQVQVEQEIAALLKRKKSHWGLRSMLLAGAGLIAWQSVDSMLNAVTSQDWLTLGWSGFIAAGAALGLASLGREFLALRRLRGRCDERAALQALFDSNGIGHATKACEKLAKQGKSKLTAGYDKWQQLIVPAHNDREVFELYDKLVLHELDNQAKKIVAKHASESALMVAVSPIAVVDMLLVAWRNIRMFEQIANLYGMRLGYWSRISLLRMVLTNMALAGASEAIGDISADLLSLGIASQLSGRVAQGLGVGLLTARLGFKAISLMRPLPYISTSAPRLGDVRRELLTRLTK